MRVEITLKDSEGDPRVILSNCIKPGFFNIEIIADGLGIADNTNVDFNINIEELKIALRKICLK